MSRSTLRGFTFVVLALLGAPVAMHVVMHDLHDHHEEIEVASVPETEHGDHEHPIVSSSAPPVASLTRVAVSVAVRPVTIPATWTCITTADRNVLSFGAMRMDDDVGLQPLLSTFLI